MAGSHALQCLGYVQNWLSGSWSKTVFETYLQAFLQAYPEFAKHSEWKTPVPLARKLTFRGYHTSDVDYLNNDVAIWRDSGGVIFSAERRIFSPHLSTLCSWVSLTNPVAISLVALLCKGGSVALVQAKCQVVYPWEEV